MYGGRRLKIWQVGGLGLSLAAALGSNPAWAGSELDLRAEVEALRRRVAELEAFVKAGSGSDVVARASDTDSRGVSFGGQYRVNGYTVDGDAGGETGRRTAARVRIRQNVDIQFTERFKSHLQVELGHTADNRTTTLRRLAVRQATLDYRFENGVDLRAGIVPLSDRFGDALFSSDWDYNPVALSLAGRVGDGNLRVFAGALVEGAETVSDDDFTHYQLDFTVPFSDDFEVDLGATLASVRGFDGDDHLHANFGIGGRLRLTDDLLVRGFVVASHTEDELIRVGSDDGDGVAAKLELTSESGLGVMATYATGKKDGSGFLPIMALAGTNGYWGYTGLLTVQGPTDTGFDGDSVNISNNGFGLATVQVRFARPLTEEFDFHLAAGWFGWTDAPSGRDGWVGGDFLAMGTYHFNSFLALDFGAAYARLGDGLSGYGMGRSASPFNQTVHRQRDKVAFFSRLQAAF